MSPGRCRLLTPTEDRRWAAWRVGSSGRWLNDTAFSQRQCAASQASRSFSVSAMHTSTIQLNVVYMYTSICTDNHAATRHWKASIWSFIVYCINHHTVLFLILENEMIVLYKVLSVEALYNVLYGQRPDTKSSIAIKTSRLRIGDQQNSQKQRNKWYLNRQKLFTYL